MFGIKILRGVRRAVIALGLAIAAMGASPADALAHCDTMDGPVVAAAREALQRGTVDGVLIWVRAEDEAEIRDAFRRALSVRRVGAEARELADRYFFETVVRVHRAAEGEPYTGLKPAGTALLPAVAAADRALTTGSAVELEALLVQAVRHGLHGRFADAREARQRIAPGDVAAGRNYVRAYVALLEYVERVHASIGGSGHPAGAGPRH